MHWIGASPLRCNPGGCFSGKNGKSAKKRKTRKCEKINTSGSRSRESGKRFPSGEIAVGDSAPNESIKANSGLKRQQYPLPRPRLRTGLSHFACPPFQVRVFDWIRILSTSLSRHIRIKRYPLVLFADIARLECRHAFGCRQNISSVFLSVLIQYFISGLHRFGIRPAP